MASSPLNNKRFKVAFLVLFGIFTGLQFFALQTFNIPQETALKDSLYSSVILALCCWLISNNLSFYQPKGNKYVYVLIWCIILAVVFSSIVEFTFPSINPNNKQYQKFLDLSIPIRYIFSLLLIGTMAAISMLYNNQQEQQELERRKNEAEKLTKEAELSSLREKLHPHFLFNSLNSISALTVTKPQEARKMVHQLSDFLRGTLKKDDILSTLKDELDHLNLYLEIEKVRFGNRLATQITADEATLEKTIPPMLLQPIVENAIKFGLYDTLEQVTITIQTKCEPPYLVVTVSNPFDTQTAHPNKGTGFGLSSIQRRLHLLYGRNDLLTAQPQSNQFTTTIKIPQI
ncbi:histidine kinase [Pelobium sp.]|nr:histidine kinase [Pelobium sp.]MDA9555197.1 histidine kinase [Pelobium sp.]